MWVDEQSKKDCYQYLLHTYNNPKVMVCILVVHMGSFS